MRTLALLLAEAMRRRGIATIRDLAARSGVSVAAARDAVAGRRRPTAGTIARFARFLALPRADIARLAERGSSAARRKRSQAPTQRQPAAGRAPSRAVRARGDTALVRLLRAVPLPLLTVLRQLTSAELRELHGLAQQMLDARTASAAAGIHASDLQRRARRFRTQRRPQR